MLGDGAENFSGPPSPDHFKWYGPNRSQIDFMLTVAQLNCTFRVNAYRKRKNQFDSKLPPLCSSHETSTFVYYIHCHFWHQQQNLQIIGNKNFLQKLWSPCSMKRSLSELSIYFQFMAFFVPNCKFDGMVNYKRIRHPFS